MPETKTCGNCLWFDYVPVDENYLEFDDYMGECSRRLGLPIVQIDSPACEHFEPIREG